MSPTGSRQPFAFAGFRRLPICPAAAGADSQSALLWLRLRRAVSIRGEFMILLLGASGYVGQAFARELGRRRQPFLAPSRKETDYTRFDVLWQFLKSKRPEFVINAAGYTGKPNVDACELARADALAGNSLLPQTIAHACAAAGIPSRAIYLPSDMAVRMVVHQLAVLTEETGEHPDRTAEKVELSRLLGVLLQK